MYVHEQAILLFITTEMGAMPDEVRTVTKKKQSDALFSFKHEKTVTTAFILNTPRTLTER